MCLNPIKVVNPTRRFSKGHSRIYLEVGCGHCKECMKRKEDDMFIRAFFEYKRCVDAGGQVWFPTLTYNDDNLPMWHDPDHDFHCQIVDTSRLKRFRDHFRMNIAREGYPIDDIRFEFVTEYGGANGRLHHHTLIFMPYKVPERIMVNCIERAWSYRLEPVKCAHTISRGPRKGQVVMKYARTADGRVVKQKVPKFGYTMWSDEWPKTLQNCKAIQYVQKYIHKPSEWLERYHILEYEQKLKDEISFWQQYRAPGSPCMSDVLRSECLKWLQDKGIFYRYHALVKKYGEGSVRKLDNGLAQIRLESAVEKLKEWRGRCRFHLQSTYFGFNGISECYKDFDDLVDGRINLHDHSSDDYELGEKFLYNMPAYYYRHIFLEKDAEENLYNKTELFDRVFEARFQKSQKLQLDSILPYFQSVSALSSHLPYYDPLEVKTTFEKIQQLMDGRDPADLVLYQTVYQGLVMSDGSKWLADLLEPVPGIPLPDADVLPLLRSHALDYLYEQHHTELFVDPTPERYRDKCRAYVYNDLPQWSELECFAGFDAVLDIISDCEASLGEKVNSAWLLQCKRDAENAKFRPKHRKNMSNNKFFIYGKK